MTIKDQINSILLMRNYGNLVRLDWEDGQGVAHSIIGRLYIDTTQSHFINVLAGNMKWSFNDTMLHGINPCGNDAVVVVLKAGSKPSIVY